ncbi:extracellular solute-binding protein [Paenibacillus qinlingensis]|uniref:Aldouronate transport system substrate-binding protein n=1 Tax=Paenibacillus qinlingensis TaxID=1837343 RepID=A0ABU1NRT4_9BACL|nr:extracellular solute-binding protein [Paenibacillus qinlingensis]MDR6550180.1 putative aldouronate transport system substrate-binding protein [Paenibacillus qinlingensis]
MKMQKKVLLGMSVVLLVGVTIGCSGNNASPASTNSGSASTSGPIKNKDLKVMRTYHPSMEQFKGNDTINDNKLVNVLKEKSGFNVKFESLPKDNPNQKISIILASGDVPDIMWIPGKSDYFKLAQQGAFEPLDDLAKQYITSLSSFLPKEILDSAKLDGKLYGIPVRVAQQVGNGILERSDILKELNLKEPATMDEMYTTLKTIKEKKNIAPLTGTGGNPGAFMASFLPYASAYGVGNTTVVKGNKLEFAWVQPEYKEFLTTMKKWYSEGLIDQEFAINKDIKDKMINGTAAFSTVYWGDALTIDTSIKDKKGSGTLQYIAPVSGKNGSSGFQEQGIPGNFIVIPKQAKNKEGAAAFINYIMNAETDKFLTYGIEGQDYKVDNGQIVQTPEQSNNIPWRTLYFFGDTDPSFTARLKVKGFLPYYEPLLKFKQNRDETAYAPSIEAFDSKFTELRNYSEENALKFIMGKRDLAEFDKFVQEFNAKGGKVAIDAMNDWYGKKK